MVEKFLPAFVDSPHYQSTNGKGEFAQK